jgi:poly-beta-1,6 N-acetyl-D-glucosamine synthase
VLTAEYVMTTASYILLVVIALKVVFFVTLSMRHERDHTRMPALSDSPPLLSILIPCYNEEAGLETSVRSLIRQQYPDFDIIIIDDGSTDGTADIGRRLANQHNGQVTFIGKTNGGKASALNTGLTLARGSIVVCMDADSALAPDALTQLARPFTDPQVDAVGGNVKVINRRRLIGHMQALEYITGLTLQRKSFAQLGAMQVISGAIGAFRRDSLLAVGGYSEDTIVEDMDVTITMARHGYGVVYNPSAIAYTEAPEIWANFAKQRYRWTFGGLQVIRKHANLLLRRKSSISLIGLPYFAIFPWIDLAVSMLFFFALARFAINHNFALLGFYAAMSSLQILLSLFALKMDGESKRLAVFAGIESLFYSHIINAITLCAGVSFLLGRSTGWNKLPRHNRISAIQTGGIMLSPSARRRGRHLHPAPVG